MKVMEANGHFGSRHGGTKKVKMSRSCAYRSYGKGKNMMIAQRINWEKITTKDIIEFIQK